MATSVIALLLAYVHAVLGLVSQLPPQTRTVILKGPSFIPDTIDPATSSQGHGLDKRGQEGAFTLCGDQESPCPEHGHPVLLQRLFVKQR